MNVDSDQLHPILRFQGRDSWETARLYYELVGEPHSLFSGSIRLLRHPLPNNEPLGAIVYRHPFAQLYLSPSVKAVMYHAAAVLHAEELHALPHPTAQSLIELFEPEELAGVLAIAFLYKHFQKHTPEVVWSELVREMKYQLHVGALVGQRLPSIGVGCGMVTGVIRYLAMSVFSRLDPKGFKGLRRHLKTHDLLFDIAWEEQKWGCTHLHIASLVLQNLGYGIGAAKGVVLGTGLEAHADPHATGREVDRDEFESQRWHAARRWIEALLIDETTPAEFQNSRRFFPNAEAISHLQSTVDKLSAAGSNFDWPLMRQDSVPADVMEGLGKLSSDAGTHTEAEASAPDDHGDDALA